MTQPQQAHTEGTPWHIEKSAKSGYNIKDADNNVPAIARVYLDGPEGLARAELLASAPTLRADNANLRRVVQLALDAFDNDYHRSPKEEKRFFAGEDSAIKSLHIALNKKEV